MTLSNIKVNSVMRAIPNGVDRWLCIDDLIVCYKKVCMNVAVLQLQKCLSSLQIWADENGFKFFEGKRVCMHFCHRHHLQPDRVLHLKRKQLAVENDVKYLRIIFDRIITIVPHQKA